MTLDPVSIAQHLVVLIGFFAFCGVWARIGRPILGWGAVLLFCVGEYGWALLALWLWSAAQSAHRRFMAQERAAGFYNGRWID